MSKKKKKTETAEQEEKPKKSPKLRIFHEQTPRHVLKLETDFSYEDAVFFFHISEQIRLANNKLTGIMQSKYEQLIRTKKYRKLLSLYRQASDSGNETKKKSLAKQMEALQKKYSVTWSFCRKSMIPIGEEYGLNSIFALTTAEDVWSGVKNCLYSVGKRLSFKKRGEFPCIRAKQTNRGIVLHHDENNIWFMYGDKKITINPADRFERDEVNAILRYLNNNPKTIDRTARKQWEENGILIDTYRPCYATIVPEIIRGKMRIFIHITIEGKVCPKYDKSGKLRRHYGTGKVGIDIGTQTIAYTSDDEVGLKNLAERGSSILENERKERLLYRSMDRSRRNMNPANYNKDGTIKKGKKVWIKSKHYRIMQRKHQELCRKNAINRHLAINQEVHHLRELGDIVITEPKNAKKLQKKTKPGTDKNGKPKRRKRFGKSIKNRCPGYFQQKLKQVFSATGCYIEVKKNYRASQYDHTADEYIQKRLSQRMYKLKDGTKVQRDWYSSFLLYEYDFATQDINKTGCTVDFDAMYQKELQMIENIKSAGIRVLNSGIKI